MIIPLGLQFLSVFSGVILMHEIALFVEDYAHRLVIGTLLQRLSDEAIVRVRLNWRSAVGGHSKVVGKFKDYLQDLDREGGLPDLIVVATDANCYGLNERSKQISETVMSVLNVEDILVMAIPDPHVERWLLLDGEAFNAVFGHGCDAPDLKCNRDEYKRRLIHAIRRTGVTPSLGGIEFAEDLMLNMNIERAMQADRSLERFVRDIRQAFKRFCP